VELVVHHATEPSSSRRRAVASQMFGNRPPVDR
jgi:hypothetical protein